MKVTPNGGFSTFFGAGGVSLYPRGLAIDAADNLYIADSDYRIRRLSADGVTSIVAGDGTSPSVYGDGGPATDAQLLAGGIALGADGSLYVADPVNLRVRKISSDGTITTVAGNGSLDYGNFGNYLGNSPDGSQATDVALSPSGVAVDSLGNLYIGERYVVLGININTYQGSIRKVGLDGVISTLSPFARGDGLAFGPDGSLLSLRHCRR